jgi:addiction module RelB/DinJ family antitoxin
MASVNINIRTDSDIKQKAQKLFERLGLDMTTAVNIFLRQAINKDTLPFDILPIVNQNKGNIPVFGSMKGKIVMADDFDAPLDDFKEYM